MSFYITPEIVLDDRDLEFRFIRSSGPGGQNVNKVSSACQLRINLHQASGISENIRSRLLQKLASKLTTEGELIVRSDRFRDQERNRQDCLDKLREWLEQAAHTPKKRVKTKPSLASRRKRLDAKKRTSDKKKMRGRVL